MARDIFDGMGIKKVVTVSRYHDFCAGHRVVGHENKCRHLHGHNYRVHFECQADDLDSIGRVIDFSVIKGQLCNWVEDNWDHKMLLWNKDPLYDILMSLGQDTIIDSIQPVGFNPTAENMGLYLLHIVGPNRLRGTGVTLKRVIVEETRKCLATVELEQ